jgi:hypothetical protein
VIDREVFVRAATPAALEQLAESVREFLPGVTAADVLRSFNRVLARHGLPPLSQREIDARRG